MKVLIFVENFTKLLMRQLSIMENQDNIVNKIAPEVLCSPYRDHNLVVANYFGGFSILKESDK